MCIAYFTQSCDKVRTAHEVHRLQLILFSGDVGTSFVRASGSFQQYPNNRRIMGWKTDVGAVGNDYALATTVFYCGIVVGEPLVR